MPVRARRLPRLLPGAPAALAAALLAAAGGISACSGGSSGARTVDLGDGRIPEARLVAAAEGLCRAADQAADQEAARLTFFGQSHDLLHTIARALEDVDRKAASEVLVGKQAVESDFAAGSPALGADLVALAAATRAGLARLDVSVPPCD